MNLSKYMTFTVKLEKKTEGLATFGVSGFASPVDIKVFTYGKNVFVREDMKQTTVSARAYLTTEDVEVGDKLDGQIVKSVDIYPESWDDKVILKECLCWNS